MAACGRTPQSSGDAATESTPPYTARPLRDISVPRTPERVARGRYLSEGLLQCFLCHSERDWTKPGAPPVPATKVFDPSDRCELVTEDRETFFCENEIDRWGFVRDQSRRVTGMINLNTHHGSKIR